MGPFYEAGKKEILKNNKPGTGRWFYFLPFLLPISATTTTARGSLFRLPKIFYPLKRIILVVVMVVLESPFPPIPSLPLAPPPSLFKTKTKMTGVRLMSHSSLPYLPDYLLLLPLCPYSASRGQGQRFSRDDLNNLLLLLLKESYVYLYAGSNTNRTANYYCHYADEALGRRMMMNDNE